MKLIRVKTDSYFFSFQKIPFKIFDISIIGYSISDNKIDNIRIMIQITKILIKYEYRRIYK